MGRIIGIRDVISFSWQICIPAEIHAAVAAAAHTSGKSINQWAAGILDRAAQI